MEETKKTTTPKNTKVVSVKLDSSTQSEIEQKAFENGLTVSEYLRQIIKDARQENKSTAKTNENVLASASSVTVDDESILLIVDVVSKAVKGSLPQSIEVITPLNENPERDYLRKLSGLPPECDVTLSVDEETYLSNLKDAITADVRTNLLLIENSVPLDICTNQMQKNMLKKMIEIRENNTSESTPSLTKVLQIGMYRALIADCNTLYNRNLFRSTYDFELKEFEALFLTEG